MIHQGCKCSD